MTKPRRPKPFDPLQHNVDCAARYLSNKQLEICRALMTELHERLPTMRRGEVYQTNLMFGLAYIRHRLILDQLPAEARLRTELAARKLEIVKL